MWKECLLTGYYAATLPARRRAAAKRATRGSEPVRVLFYHRVADDHSNAWTMSTATFARQIRWLRERFDIVGLSEAQARIASGRNAVPTACITFDDGYADNMQFALPLLIDRQVPFTYFVSTNHVLGGRPFPHDAKAGHPLAVNTLNQLRELVAAGVEIGGHTRSHANLGEKQSASELVDEIAGCKTELEKSLGTTVRHFAFPYGQHANMTPHAFQVALAAGYAGVCSAYGGYNFPGDDAFHLRRIHADPEMIRFKNWLTVDARKQRAHRDFDPGDYRAASATPRNQSAALSQARSANKGPIKESPFPSGTCEGPFADSLAGAAG